MMNTDKPEIIKKIEDAINSGDKEATSTLLETMYEDLKSDLSLINWFIVPLHLTTVQNLITERFGIPRKAMMVRNRVSDRKRRALMFAHAMRIAVNRSLNG